MGPDPNDDNKNIRYKQLLEVAEKLSAKFNINVDLTCNKTLYELMHAQTRYPIDVCNNKLQEVLQIDNERKLNDILELFYFKNYTITPLIYRSLLSMCSPDSVGCLNLDYQNQSALIFDHTGLFDEKVFKNEYLLPFYYEKILPQLQNEFENNIEEYLDKEIIISSKSKWLEEYKEKVYNNMYIVKYSTMIELLFKVQDIPNTLEKIQEVSLIIIDSPNLLLNKMVKLECEHVDSNIIVENDNFRRDFHVKKKKRKSTNQKQEDKMFDKIVEVLNNFQKEFNFNLIYTFYDFERRDNLNYLRFKMNDQNFSFDNHNRHFKIKVGEEGKVEFIFTLDDFADKNKILSVEPSHYYFNLDANIFGYIVHIEGKHYKFFAFIKGHGADTIQVLEEKDLEFIDTKKK